MIFLKCAGCPESNYRPSKGVFHLSFLKEKARLWMEETPSKCLPCPLGGECPGHTLVPKPNFWGIYSSEKVTFYRCPVGYCCSGQPGDPCDQHNACSSTRTGALCSACRSGFSQSMLSSTCMPNDACRAHWFWVVVVLAAFVYMIWYTFKDDALKVPVAILHKIMRFFQVNPNFPKENVNSTYVDKRYFGILIYYVQATAVLRTNIYLNSVDKLTHIMSLIETNIGFALTVELSYMPANVCPVSNISTTVKQVAKFVFLLGILLSWFSVFGILLLYEKISHRCSKEPHQHTGLLKQKLISGLVKILKYSYGGYTKIVFFSLFCVTVGGNDVWFHDASVLCFSAWQKFMVIFGIGYIIAFPLMLFCGMKLLEKGCISGTNLLLGTLCPLPCLLLWLVQNCNRFKRSKGGIHDVDDNNIGVNTFRTEEDRKMYLRFKRGYRAAGGAQYWESVMLLRRLLLNIATLAHNIIIKSGVCVLLCTLFLMHHMYIQPFAHSTSNRVESLSLFLLCFGSTVNLGKSIYSHLGVTPGSSEAQMLETLSFMETIFLPGLVSLIFILEIRKSLCGQKHTEAEKNS